MSEVEVNYALPVDPDVPPPPVHVSNHLDIDEFERGKIYRVFIELVGDGLATGVRVPVLVARGANPGPVFGLTSTVHGNELNGIPVIHQLFHGLDLADLHGTMVGVVAVNVPALHRFQRELHDGTDINRIFPGDPNGNVAQVYAHRIIDRIVKHFDWLVDLHTASFGRVNSLYVRADMTNPTTAAMAYLQHPQIIVHNEAGDKTLRGAAGALGIPAITVEIGDPQQWQKRYTLSTLRGVWAVLGYAGVLDPDDAPSFEGVAEPVICTKSGWMYTDRGGLLEVFPGVAERVEKGQRIATVKNAFGDMFRAYDAPRDGIVIGKSTNPVGFTGARILHLGRVADENHAFVRRMEAQLGRDEHAGEGRG